MRRVVWLLSLVILSLALSAVGTAVADAPLTLTLHQQRVLLEALRVKANMPLIPVLTNKDTKDEAGTRSSLRIEKVIPTGKTLQLKIPALKPGTYEFIGDFHEKTAHGRIITE